MHSWRGVTAKKDYVLPVTWLAPMRLQVVNTPQRSRAHLSYGDQAESMLQYVSICHLVRVQYCPAASCNYRRQHHTPCLPRQIDDAGVLWQPTGQYPAPKASVYRSGVSGAWGASALALAVPGTEASGCDLSIHVLLFVRTWIYRRACDRNLLVLDSLGHTKRRT